MPVFTMIACRGVTFTMLLALSLAVRVSPPPDTVAVFVTLAGAFGAKLTAKVIDG
jgi:hypothetical protein